MIQNRFIPLLFLSFFLFNISGVQRTSEPITFQADRMEYIYKKDKEQVILNGNAVIERSDFFIKAQMINIYGINRDFAKAYNNVKMINKINNVIIYGDYGEYDNNAEYAKVFKSPKLVYTNRKLEIISAVMETYLKENKSVALGDVKITQTNYTAYCEKAVYEHQMETIELTGDPIVYYNHDIFQAKKIILYTKKNLVKLYDRVGARIISTGPAEK